MDMSHRFSQDIARIQSEQIGQRITAPSERKIAESAFRDEFKQKLGLTDEADILHFSNHAISRLQKRNIDITPADLQRISNAVEKASSKGSRDSLILIDDLALVVSVASKTVVTAMEKSSMKDQVVTNIDSAVIG